MTTDTSARAMDLGATVPDEDEADELEREGST